ncbi:SRPBCC family protein [Streptomyces sp. NPDC057694]|uniref:SRPBCC family protein n=1 Tax=Streptomyces sp. NPDC057694 TaxID=3346216 RepID=UPI0036948B95
MAESPTKTLGGFAKSQAADHLKSEVQEYLAAQAQRMLMGAGRKLGQTTLKLNDIAEGNSPGFAKLALDGGRKIAEGKGPMRSAVELGAGHLKDKVVGGVKGLFGKGGKKKGGAGKKPTVIMEFIDVGVDLRTAYDQWTQYQEFSTFARGVKNANRADDVTSDWQMKVFWSSRSWKAHTTEQVPDDRIQWTSEGAKGTTKGVITFHRLADRLTRVLLVIEYYPKGLFEKTGNIWRAQGRRARLDLKHFARFVTIRGEASDGWRGEIRDGEVVTSHEDALAQEEEEQERDQEQEDQEEQEEGKPADEYDEEAGEQEESEDDADPDREEYDDEAEAEYDDAEDGYEDEPQAEAEEYEDGDDGEDGEYEDYAEEDAEPEEGAEADDEKPARGRQRAGSGARR